MEFKKEDENYIYEIISKNVKKYRKLKGWTQEKLASEINYSLSFISGIESAYHQTFSLGAIWRISQALDIEFSRLCEDASTYPKENFILYQCDTCKTITKIPVELSKLIKDSQDILSTEKQPQFECTEPNCQGKIKPVNPLKY